MLTLVKENVQLDFQLLFSFFYFLLNLSITNNTKAVNKANTSNACPELPSIFFEAQNKNNTNTKQINISILNYLYSMKLSNIP